MTGRFKRIAAGLRLPSVDGCDSIRIEKLYNDDSRQPIQKGQDMTRVHSVRFRMVAGYRLD